MVGCVIIKNDLFDIDKRLKEIDRGYFAVYNFRKKRFEVHHSGQKNTYCLTVPYDALDERTVRLVRKTRLERMEQLQKEIERENAKKEKEIRNQVIKQAQKAVEEVL